MVSEILSGTLGVMLLTLHLLTLGLLIGPRPWGWIRGKEGQITWTLRPIYLYALIPQLPAPTFYLLI